MRTLVRATWIVGHRNGRHELLRDGELVYEGERILHAGYGWQGHVDQHLDLPGHIACPGFIDTHVHSGHRALHRLLSDSGRPELLGQPFLEIALRRPDGVDARSALGNAELQADYTVAELLRGGITSFVEFGSGLAIQQRLAAVAARTGIRAWLGCGYESYVWYADPSGRRRRRAHPDEGRAELAHALEFADSLQGNPRVQPLLVPRDADTCSPALLELTARTARERDLPVAIHAGYSPWEFYEVLAEHGCTPIELLERTGLLQPRTLIGHGNYLAGSARLQYPGGHDLERIASGGATVSHCPINLARRGRVLDHWGRYRAAGVRIALGTDTYPRDMFQQMRAASYMGKMVAGDYTVAGAAEVFDAATLAPADWLGRADLGRLEPGAQADIALVDLTGSLRLGPIRDPIRTLVEVAVSDDVRAVVIAGKMCVNDGKVDGMDLASLKADAQADGETQWNDVARWDPLGRTADERSPLSYPLSHPPRSRDGPLS